MSGKGLGGDFGARDVEGRKPSSVPPFHRTPQKAADDASKERLKRPRSERHGLFIGRFFFSFSLFFSFFSFSLKAVLFYSRLLFLVPRFLKRAARASRCKRTARLWLICMLCGFDPNFGFLFFLTRFFSFCRLLLFYPTKYIYVRVHTRYILKSEAVILLVLKGCFDE